MLPLVMGVLGVGVTLLGVGFLLLLAWQNGLFGPIAQVATAAAVSAVLVVLAFRVHGQDPENTGALALLATGSVAAHLTVFAASGMHHFMPVLAGQIAGAVVGLAGQWIAVQWRSQWLALVASVATVMLVPWLGGLTPTTAGALVLWCLASVAITVGQGWPILLLVQMIPTALVVWGASADLPGDPWSLIWAAVLALGTLAVVVWQRDVPRHVGVGIGLASLFGCLPLWQIAAAESAPGYPAMVPIGVLVVVALAQLGVALAPGLASEIGRSVALTLAPISLWVLASCFLQGEWLAVAAISIALGWAAIGHLGRTPWASAVAAVVAALVLMSWLARAGALFDYSPRLAQSVSVTTALVPLVGVGVIYLLWLAASGRPERWLPWVAFGAGLACLSGAVVASALLLGRLVGAELGGFQTGHVIVTIGFMAVAAWFFARALRVPQGRDASVRAGVVLSVVAVIKLFLIDLGQLPGLARAITFLVVGGLLLLVGTRYARALDQAKRGGPPPDGPPPGGPPAGPPVSGPPMGPPVSGQAPPPGEPRAW